MATTPKKPAAFVPYIPAHKEIPEITFQSIFLGLFLGVILAAANTYLGLYAGMTVSAAIPAAVLSMGILRGILKRGTILENNIVQTMASSGESLAAGVIFTVPALVLTGVWTEFHYWPATLMCLTGGMLGIIFMIPLRQSHVVEDTDLTYPEGLACAEVLKCGEKGGGGALILLYSMLVGGFLKFLTTGTSLLKGVLEGAWVFGKTGFYFGADVSAALLGVGYIVGFNIACLMFLGGAIAWCIALPLLGMSGITGDPMDWFWTMWSTKIRYMGVGAMIVGGVWSIISIRKGIVKGLKEAFLGYKKAGKKAATVLRTEQGMRQSHILLLLGLTTAVIVGLYQFMLNDITITIASTISTLIMSFLFIAVASYIVGLVGSSSSPVSGMTICAVLGTGGMLLVFNMTGASGIMATLIVAGVVCCAVCSSGDISQDLKTGYLIGATPRRQQWTEVIAAVVTSLVIVPVMSVLQHAYGIGTGAPGSLKAPQATLFANLVKALFGQGELPWEYVKIGALLGVGIILVDLVLKRVKSNFRTPIMAVAVGIYLPLTLSVPIFIGGIISALMQRKRKESETDSGTLFASGLIAGEAIAGVSLGAVIYFSRDALPVTISVEMLTGFIFLGLCALMIAVARKSTR